MAVRQRKNAKPEKALAESKSKEQGPYTDYGKQLLILVALVLPWVVLLTVPLSAIQLHKVLNVEAKETPYSLIELLSELYDSLHLNRAFTLTYLSTRDFWLTLAALSLPHLTYLIVWTNSKAFYAFSSKYLSFLGEPYQAFAVIAHAIKLFQTAAIVIWYATPEWLLGQSSQVLVEAGLNLVRRISVPQAVLGVEMFLLGQLFNGAVYATIGEAGVYYGCRLGKQIPWVYGFPFSTVPHPQYLGATISIWGGLFLTATDFHVQRGLYAIGVAMTFYYSFSSYVEACL